MVVACRNSRITGKDKNHFFDPDGNNSNTYRKNNKKQQQQQQQQQLKPPPPPPTTATITEKQQPTVTNNSSKEKEARNQATNYAKLWFPVVFLEKLVQDTKGWDLSVHSPLAKAWGNLSHRAFRQAYGIHI